MPYPTLPVSQTLGPSLSGAVASALGPRFLGTLVDRLLGTKAIAQVRLAGGMGLG